MFGHYALGISCKKKKDITCPHGLEEETGISNHTNRYGVEAV